MSVVVQIDAKQLADMGLAVKMSADNAQYTRALNAAINRSGRSATADPLKKDLRERTSIKADRLNRALKVTPATFETLQYTVSASGRPIPLSYFDVRQTRRGVSARAWGKRTVYRGTFIATMQTGHMGVFRRNQTASRRERRYDERGRVYYTELPIIELAGPSIPRTMLQGPIKEAWEAKVRQRLPIEFERELNRVVSGFKGRQEGVRY
jgi:hypothetical protein